MTMNSTMKSKITNPIALTALKVAMKNNLARPASSSKTADKFVVYTSKEIIAAMATLGELHGRSKNSEITCAVIESLAGRRQATTALRLLSAYVGPEASKKAILQVQRFDKDPSCGKMKTVIRLPDGIRFRVAEAVAQSVAAGGPIRLMNSWFIDAMIWWINNQNENYALFSACIDLDLRENSRE